MSSLWFSQPLQRAWEREWCRPLRECRFGEGGNERDDEDDRVGEVDGEENWERLDMLNSGRIWSRWSQSSWCCSVRSMYFWRAMVYDCAPAEAIFEEYEDGVDSELLVLDADVDRLCPEKKWGLTSNDETIEAIL